MSEKAKSILEKIDALVTAGKVSDIDLGTMLGIAMTSNAGQKPCQQ